jgi:hypothetical protein
MDLSFPDAGDIDSRCHRKLPDAETPDAILDRCKDEAVTWFERERGYSFYVCEAHAREVLRFGAANSAVLDMGINDLRRLASQAGINSNGMSRADLQRTLLVAPDASDLPDHPRVSPCRGCHKLTRYDDLNHAALRCPACRDGVPEIDVDDAVLTSDA